MAPSSHSATVEPIDRLLYGGIMFLVLVLVGVSKWSPNDGQTFQVISGLLTTFSGAFVGRMVPKKSTGVPGAVVTPPVQSDPGPGGV